MSKRYKCEIFDSSEVEFFYPRNFKPKRMPKKVAFGSKVIAIDCQHHPNGRNVISLSSQLASQLGLPSNVSAICLFENDEIIFLGPLVGIFSSGFTPFHLAPLGERSPAFSRLLAVQSSIGVVPFLFGEQHIDWDLGVIHGYFFQDNGWEKRTLPFPNVVYDRLPTTGGERIPSVEKVKTTFENDYLIPWYNPSFFNPLEIFERLYNDEQIDQYLPETISFTSFTEIERMLADYGHVFLKNSSNPTSDRTKQIIYDRTDNHYYCRFYKEKNRLLLFESLESLMNYIAKSEKLENMLVQQGIHLLRINKQPIYFRVLANKDEAGEWCISTIVAKLAGKSHSTELHAEPNLSIIFPEKEQLDAQIEKLKHAALELAAAMENTIGGIIGEIGFALGLDQDRQIWLLEIDPKPELHEFTYSGLNNDLLTKKLTLSFSVYLTEKTIQNPSINSTFEALPVTMEQG